MMEKIMSKRKKTLLRKHMLPIRLTQKEYERLMDDTKNANIKNENVSEYIRRKLFRDHTDIVRIKVDFKELVYQIRKIGVNVNQIAARKNAGLQFKEDDQELLIKMEQINQLLSNIEKQLEGLYGNH